MGFLDRLNHSWTLPSIPPHPTRNLRSHPPVRTRCSSSQIHRRRIHLCSPRPRKERLETNGHHHTYPPNTHDHLRTSRLSDLSVPFPRLRNLLHVFHRLSHHISGNLPPISRVCRANVSSNWSGGYLRHLLLPMVGLLPAKSSAGEQTLDEEGRIETPSPSMCRWTTLRYCPLMAWMDRST